jgi:mannose-6-phosphate isomerase-like protein (cupin superfamily)
MIIGSLISWLNFEMVTQVNQCYNGEPWESWEVLGLEVKSDKYKLAWKNSCDMSHAWTGLMRLLPGQEMPTHTHTTPEIYYILQGKPIVSLNYVNNRTSTWQVTVVRRCVLQLADNHPLPQCVSIPSECPHSITNDTNEEVVIAWCYLSIDVVSCK